MGKTIKAPGKKNTNIFICGKRPRLNQQVFNPMIMCNLKPKHKGSHSWKRI